MTQGRISLDIELPRYVPNFRIIYLEILYNTYL